MVSFEIRERSIGETEFVLFFLEIVKRSILSVFSLLELVKGCVGVTFEITGK